MPSFQFRPQRVLEWQRTRRAVEEMRVKQLTAALEDKNAALARLEAARTATELEVLGLAGLEGRDLAALAAYRTHMTNTAQQMLQDCRSCQQLLTEQRLKWSACHRQVRLLEKLKSRRFLEFEIEAGREIDKVAAEVYLNQWHAGNDTGQVP